MKTCWKKRRNSSRRSDIRFGCAYLIFCGKTANPASEKSSAARNSVGEIVRRTKAPQATVSLHLGRMRRCGIVISRREAREVYYWIATEIAQVVADALHRKHDRALGLDPLS